MSYTTNSSASAVNTNHSRTTPSIIARTHLPGSYR
jgi:hypothetical protein